MLDTSKFSLWDFIKLLTQAVAVIAFLFTLQQNQQHINSELDGIRKQTEKIDEIKERVIVLETKLNYLNKNEYVFSGANNRKEFNSK